MRGEALKSNVGLHGGHPGRGSEAAALRLENRRLRDDNDRLNAEHGELRAKNDLLDAANKKLRLENEELRARLSLNSGNSSKPPSTDGLGRGRVGKQRGLREKSGKRPGGQPGHPGNCLKQVEAPDRTVQCRPQVCGHCGVRLPHDGGGVGERRQVFDIPPPPQIEVTEFQRIDIICPHCHGGNSGMFPDNVNGPVQYGDNISATIVSLTHGNSVAIKRAADFVNDSVLGVRVSTGTICNLLERCWVGLSLWLLMVKLALQNASSVNFDETGIHINGKIYWLHSASTEWLTYLYLHPRRGSQGSDSAGVLPAFHGVATHDCWSPYFNYDACSHNLCRAHLLREMIAIGKEAGEFTWAGQMKSLLKEMKFEVDSAGAAGLDAVAPEIIADIGKRYDDILALAASQHPSKEGGYWARKAFNLAKRLREHRGEVLCFLEDVAIPFDNNQAERDIRGSKVKMKVSGCFRSVEGGEYYAALESYLSTARKNGVGQIEAIKMLLAGKPYFPPAMRTDGGAD